MKMRHRLPLLVSAAILAVTGCGTGDDGGSGSDGRLSVATSFYPLQHAAEQVGGEHVEVTNLTKPGAEPHDLELTPALTAEIVDADLVVWPLSQTVGGNELGAVQAALDLARDALLTVGGDTPDR